MVYIPDVLDRSRGTDTDASGGGNNAVISDFLASTCPNEVGHLLRYRGVLPEPRYVGSQVVHHDPGTAFGEKFDVCPPQPAARPGHHRDLPLQRNSLSHLATLLQPATRMLVSARPSAGRQRRHSRR